MKLTYITLALLLLSYCALGQSVKTDSSFLADAKKNSIAVYNSYIAAQSHLFNGSAYIEYQSQQEEHPYYIDEWLDGTVVYDGEFYTNVPLLYDLTLDKLITDHPYGFNKIQLVSQKLEQFTIGKHRFVKLQEKEIPKGFYELMHDDKTKVYVRWQKSLQKRTESGAILNQFDNRITYYIKKDGVFYNVKSKKSVLNVFADRKAEIKKFLRENNLRLKTDRAIIISRMAEVYDQSKQ